jgi:leucine dehydrogenase
MAVFDNLNFDEHEQVVYASDPVTGLRAIVAVHNTSRGPALGGCRMWPYATDQEAVTDVLRLSRGMTYKAAMAHLPLGGGKTVIIGNARRSKSPELFRALGRVVEALNGRYIVAEDVGTSPSDMLEVRKQTRHVAGTPAEHGGGGDTSPATADGVFVGLLATVRHALKREGVAGLTVAVQGLGGVGYGLCRHLHGAGAKLVVTDLDANPVAQAEREFEAIGVGLDEIFSIEAGVFSQMRSVRSSMSGPFPC